MNLRVIRAWPNIYFLIFFYPLAFWHFMNNFSRLYQFFIRIVELTWRLLFKFLLKNLSSFWSGYSEFRVWCFIYIELLRIYKIFLVLSWFNKVRKFGFLKFCWRRSLEFRHLDKSSLVVTRTWNGCPSFELTMK
jgi:hypothetical protein